MGVELPLLVVVTIVECCVTFSGVKLSIRSFVLFHGGLSRSVYVKDGCGGLYMALMFVKVCLWH